MVSVGTNNMVLELSRSANNAKDVSNDKNEDNNTKVKERDDTNNIVNKSNNSAKETMASAVALIQDSGARTNKVTTMPRMILIAETKMKTWTRLRMTM